VKRLSTFLPKFGRDEESLSSRGNLTGGLEHSGARVGARRYCGATELANGSYSEEGTGRAAVGMFAKFILLINDNYVIVYR
jgi:hypothetical protein